MKTILAFIFILSSCPYLRAQKNSHDSIKIFYKQLFLNLQSTYLHKEEVDWETVRSQTESNLIKYSSFQSSLNEIRTLFDKIGADHCGIYYKNKHYSSSRKPVSHLLNDEWKAKYASKPVYEVKTINHDIGYILMPKIIFFEVNEKNIRAAAQPIYDEISMLKSRKQLKGWIIDLRLNTGGNSTPMLLALYDFLGNGTIWHSSGLDHKIHNTIKLDKGCYYDNSKKQGSVKTVPPLLDRSKVAVLIGPATASAGEIVALGFKGRPDTIFIGEETYGATSGNIEAALPFGAVMALTTSIDTDRSGNYYAKISPDVTIVMGDNFGDLLQDKKIEKAISHINSF